MKKFRTAKSLIGSLIVAACLAACKGGGEEAAVNGMAPSSNVFHSGAPSAEAFQAGAFHMLSWNVPEATVNHKTINPYEDLYRYELYVSTTATFSEKDAPVALFSAVEYGQVGYGAISKKLVTEFDLDLLGLRGRYPSSRLYVSLRVVGVDGQKSGFMNPVTWPRS